MFRILLIGAMLLISTMGFAEEESSSKGAYVKLYGGSSKTSFSESYTDNAADVLSATGSSEIYGIAFGGYITDSFSLEVAVEQYETEARTRGFITGTGTVEADVLFINGYYHFNDYFYVGAGIGGGDPKISNVRVTAVAMRNPPRNAADRNRLTRAERKRLTDSVDELPYQGILGFKVPLTDSIEWDNNVRRLIVGDLEVTMYHTGIRFNF